MSNVKFFKKKNHRKFKVSLTNVKHLRVNRLLSFRAIALNYEIFLIIKSYLIVTVYFKTQEKTLNKKPYLNPTLVN